MHRFSYRALPLSLSLVLLAVMGILLPESPRTFAAEHQAKAPQEDAEQDLRSSDVLSFGEMELRVLSDCSEGLCAPIHTITWGNGETLELTQEQLSEPIEHVTICDLDRDGDLELALTSASCGSGRYGEFLLLEWTEGAWKAHKLCEVVDSELTGCMGHQRITVWEDHVEVAFPLYAVDDPNCCPTDGSRSLSYVYEGDSFKLSESIEGPPSQAMGWNG